MVNQFLTEAKTIQWERIIFSACSVGIIGYPHAKPNKHTHKNLNSLSHAIYKYPLKTNNISKCKN